MIFEYFGCLRARPGNDDTNSDSKTAIDGTGNHDVNDANDDYDDNNDDNDDNDDKDANYDNDDNDENDDNDDTKNDNNNVRRKYPFPKKYNLSLHFS